MSGHNSIGQIFNKANVCSAQVRKENRALGVLPRSRAQAPESGYRVTGIPFGPVSLGMRRFSPAFFGISQDVRFNDSIIEAKTKAKRKEWAEMRREFPLSWFWIREAAAILKVSEKRVMQLAREGKLERAKYDNVYWIEPGSVLEYQLQKLRRLGIDDLKKMIDLRTSGREKI